MTRLASMSILATLVTVAACESTPRRVDATDPTVTYRYQAGDAEIATRNAANYCAERYNGRASVVSRRVDGDTFTATYECVR